MNSRALKKIFPALFFAATNASRGSSHLRRRRQLHANHCDNLTHIKGTACGYGGCQVLVEITGYGTCRKYCADHLRSCEGAWEETNDNCEILSKHDCDFEFNGTSDAICRCSSNADEENHHKVTTAIERKELQLAKISPISVKCGDLTQVGKTCTGGDDSTTCKVLVSQINRSMFKSCGMYCSFHGRKCYGAWEIQNRVRACSPHIRTSRSCKFKFTRYPDALCECSDGSDFFFEGDIDDWTPGDDNAGMLPPSFLANNDDFSELEEISELHSALPPSVPSFLPSIRVSVYPTIRPSGQPSKVLLETLSYSPTHLVTLGTSYSLDFLESLSMSPSHSGSSISSLLGPNFIPSTDVRPENPASSSASLSISPSPFGSSISSLLDPTFIPSTDIPFENPAPSSTTSSSIPANHSFSAPTIVPITKPTVTSSSTPALPSGKSISSPYLFPSMVPPRFPTTFPSNEPSSRPYRFPSRSPMSDLSSIPSSFPSYHPFFAPVGISSTKPTGTPSSARGLLSGNPISDPSLGPSMIPSQFPTSFPSLTRSTEPTSISSRGPLNNTPAISSFFPSFHPSFGPTVVPPTEPKSTPSSTPVLPSGTPSSTLSLIPSMVPSQFLTYFPSLTLSTETTLSPSVSPSRGPLNNPSAILSFFPSFYPSSMRTVIPSTKPTSTPSYSPVLPSGSSSSAPSLVPSTNPSQFPTYFPSLTPSTEPLSGPSGIPSQGPMNNASSKPTSFPSYYTSSASTVIPLTQPTGTLAYAPVLPSGRPTIAASLMPSTAPSHLPISFRSMIPSTELSSALEEKVSMIKYQEDQQETPPTESPTDEILMILNRAKESCKKLKDVKKFCGDGCEVLANIKKYKTCGKYCAAHELSCVGAWEEKDNDCVRKKKHDCSDNFSKFTSDALCRCFLSPSVSPSRRPTNDQSPIPLSFPTLLPSTQVTSTPSNTLVFLGPTTDLSTELLTTRMNEPSTTTSFSHSNVTASQIHLRKEPFPLKSKHDKNTLALQMEKKVSMNIHKENPQEIPQAVSSANRISIVSETAKESCKRLKDVKKRCGNSCEVLANIEKYKTCSKYCAAHGLLCEGAWEEKDNDCVREKKHNCYDNFSKFTSDALCKCFIHKAPVSINRSDSNALAYGHIKERECPTKTVSRKAYPQYPKEGTNYDEISMIAFSKQTWQDEPVVWIANDGSNNSIYASLLHSGKSLCTVDMKYTVMPSTDLESISLGPCGASKTPICLFVADTGNNPANVCKDDVCKKGRKITNFFKFEEPDIEKCVNTEKLSVDVARLPVQYYDTHTKLSKNADSEAMFVDYTGDDAGGMPGDIYVLTKWYKNPSLVRIHKYPSSLHQKVMYGQSLQPYEMSSVDLSIQTRLQKSIWTGADMSTDGSLILLRTYSASYTWRRNSYESVAKALKNKPCSNFFRSVKTKEFAKYESAAFYPNRNAIVEISECFKKKYGECTPEVTVIEFE